MKTQPRQIRLPLDIIERVQQEAERERRRFSNMVAVLLEEALATRHPTPPPATGEQGTEREE